MLVLDTYRIFKDETDVTRIVRCAMPYCDMAGPFEDCTYLFPDHPHVTSFKDDVGNDVCVLEPLQRVLDGWLLYYEREAGSQIKFSAS